MYESLEEIVLVYSIFFNIINISGSEHIFLSAVGQPSNSIIAEIYAYRYA